ncbi:Acyl-CoA synthetases (AMP-forming)/AMP-acid ligases II [Paramagnetospirillum magnetotacticum MS-1]|uniref:Acyl-CoA synthetases (AMP-forming)/AMP-acid ligases II n=1 Tax=Paramagnetospirillum magnetotacticum MS-1 TaxID=272627 RepID=A0A0C2YU38_PARME|nr:hypothetical protein [Paramagnetospirillum magnetotacticum]KIL98215.1 Acyl-CoA synthetases (AMP-forming)/AMP-acid ligases II [Paramagnetospirillum magnetotacticum MS-1]
MIARHFRLVAALVAALTASACQNTKPPMQKLPEISFANLRPFQLDVGQLEIVSEFVATGRSPNIEHLMPVSPEGAAQRWAQDRLKPVGRIGTARVIIKDAKVVEVPLAIDKGLSGAFKKEQELRYDAALDVALQILDQRGMVQGETMARATRSRTVAEGLTLNERDRVLYDISESLAKDIDQQMAQLIQNYLGRWVR